MCSVSRVRPPGSPRTRRHFFQSGFQSVRSATGLSPLDSAHRWHELCARGASGAASSSRRPQDLEASALGMTFDIWLFFRGSKGCKADGYGSGYCELLESCVAVLPAKPANCVLFHR
jgi:hypothetical protein